MTSSSIVFFPPKKWSGIVVLQESTVGGWQLGEKLKETSSQFTAEYANKSSAASEAWATFLCSKASDKTQECVIKIRLQ